MGQRESPGGGAARKHGRRRPAGTAGADSGTTGMIDLHDQSHRAGKALMPEQKSFAYRGAQFFDLCSVTGTGRAIGVTAVSSTISGSPGVNSVANIHADEQAWNVCDATWQFATNSGAGKVEDKSNFPTFIQARLSMPFAVQKALRSLPRRYERSYSDNSSAIWGCGGNGNGCLSVLHVRSKKRGGNFWNRL